jgi:hypothetical protein
MPRWLRAYLSDRRFQISFEGELSTLQKTGSGVPQGAILSPTLFNVLMHEIPSSVGVKCAKYADDVAFSPGMQTWGLLPLDCRTNLIFLASGLVNGALCSV